MAQAKGRRDGPVSSNENARRLLPSSGGAEGVAWQGPRTVLLQKNAQGFGFTLRHFIVYPPESSLQPGNKDEENGNAAGKGCQRSRLEPMDTIFVKSVRNRGPAHQAGLCTGDRLVQVNGESVLGKTYSQVIALIQNSANVLELSIMPKDEDVLQLAFSQDAYQRGNEPYTGGAQSLPEPPPLCYPPRPLKPAAPPPPGHAPLDNRPVAAAATPTSGWPGGPGRRGPEEDGGGSATPGQDGRRRRSSSAVGALDFHFANHNAAIASATLPRHRPPPRKGSLPASSTTTAPRARPPEPAAARTRALSDWYYSQAEAAVAERIITPRHRSVSQDALTELGPVPVPPHLHSHWLGGGGGGGGWGGGARSSCSEGLLAAAYGEYERSYGRSVDTLGRAAAALAPPPAPPPARYERTPPPVPPQLAAAPPPQPAVDEHQQRLGNQQKTPKSIAVGVVTATSAGRRSQQQVAEPQTRRREEEEGLEGEESEGEEPEGYRSYSPSFCRKAGHLLQQAGSFSGPRLRWSPAHDDEATPPPGGEGGGGGGGVKTPALPPASSADAVAPTRVQEAVSPPPPPSQEEKGEEPTVVVLRQKPPSGRRTPVRHPGHEAEPPVPPPPYGTPSPPPCGGGPGSGEVGLRKANGSLAPPLPHPHALDSLSSIPFIDEPTSPSADLCARHVPASSVVSSSATARRPSVPAPPAPLLLPPTPSNAPPTPLSSSSDSSSPPPVKLRPRDCSSVKGRRSSYLLAITTERSKSCDEGLNTFRDEGRMFSRLPKRVKSFFTDGSLESLRAAEEARSKRHSTSELGTITFSNVRKEGWLHYKQILTEKGKKVGGGMRPWKRVFSVLRCHSLFLYKDKREAVLHGAGAGSGAGSGPGSGHASSSQDEHPPISIRGCLIDIAYSETKRKHALRLTTQDFCEYLLQAEDRDDMLAWIRVIRENGKTDSEELGFSRQALINKKLNDYRKQSPTGNKPDTSPRTHRMMPFLLAKTDNASMNRSSKTDESKAPWGINLMKKAKKAGNPKAFGARLEDCQPAVNNKFVPLIVEMCCGLVESMGLDYTGIYRVPGNNALVSNLQEQLNKGMEINVTEERWQDLNVISSLLKSFFRKLPEPLFTDDKYIDFIDANRLDDAEVRLKTMKKLIHDLPDHYHHTLKFLVGHLKRVADNSDKNKMEPRNLALVFGPTLVRTSDDNMTDMVTHMPDRYKIIETLILHYDWFFSDGDLHKDGKTPVDNKDMQPVPNIDHLLSNIGRTGMPGDISDSTTSDSIKSKASWDARRDMSARDFLPLSIINAVTRKRKKSPSVRPASGSTDDDSEHEPIKSGHYGGGGGGGGGGKGQGEGEGEAIGGGGGPEKREGPEGGKEKRKKEVKQPFVRGGGGGGGLEEEEEEEEEEEGGGRGKGGRATWENGGRTESGLPTKPRPNSFLYSHYQPPATGAAVAQPLPPPEAPRAPLSPLPKLPSLAKARSIFPSWLSPSSGPPGPPGHALQQSGPPAQQQLPLRCRSKTRAGRPRAVSMNLELGGAGAGGVAEDGGGGGARVRRGGERPEARRSTTAACGVPQGSVVGPVAVRESSGPAPPPPPAPPPRPALEPAPLASPSSSSAAWADQGSSPSAAVAAVLRRTTLGPRDKGKAWRRHTVLV